MRRTKLLLLMLTGCGPCRSCDVTPPDTESSDTAHDSGLTQPDDTAPPPPCDLPEIEPNNALFQAQLLPLEVVACGELDPMPDFDNWRFEVPVAQWLGVYLHSTSIGSRADTALVLIDQDEQSFQVDDRDDGEQDVELVFPAPPGTYTALVVDQNNLGGPDDYFYELLVSEAKQPVEYTLLEVDADTADQAQPLDDGDVVFALIDAARDTDWYRVPIPAGTASVEIVVAARQHGSPAKLRLELFEGAGLQPIGTLTSSADGASSDPSGERATQGDTEWFIKVVERTGSGGYAFWYALSVELKGEP